MVESALERGYKEGNKENRLATFIWEDLDKREHIPEDIESYHPAVAYNKGFNYCLKEIVKYLNDNTKR
jgi:hypothetical protein